MAKVDLPDGGWADIRDPEKITERQRRPFLQAMNGLADKVQSDQGYESVGELYDLVFKFMLSEWSYGPITDDAILDLPARTHDVLKKHADEFIKSVTPGLEEPDPDDGSPTKP